MKSPGVLPLILCWYWAAGLGGSSLIVVHGFTTTTLGGICKKSGVCNKKSTTLGRVFGNDDVQQQRSTLFLKSSSTNNNNEASAAQLPPVIDQLSNECISAIMVAMEKGRNTMGLTQLSNELLFLGLLTHPERAKKTLSKYDFLSKDLDQRVETAVSNVLGVVVEDDDDDMTTTAATSSSLPFSIQTKLLLNKAVSISDHLESSTVRSEHVLLALFGYNFGRRIVDKPPVFEILEQIIMNIGSSDDGFSCSNFCQTLIQDLSEQPNEDMTGSVVRKETIVVGGRKTGAISGTLAQVGIDLTQQAMEGQLDPVYGRNVELKSALRTLGRRRKNNPCLIGDPGVGKTAIAEGIAQILGDALLQQQEMEKGSIEIEKPRFQNPFRRNKDRQKEQQQEEAMKDDIKAQLEEEYDLALPPCPKDLIGKRLVSVDLASLVAGTSNRGDFEKRVKNLIEEASNSDIILFIDEIHNLVGAGDGGSGAMNAANLLKPALARGEIRVLGATTTPEYRKYIEKDGALERRLQPLTVKEPSVDETIKILASICNKYEEYHGVEYTTTALRAAAKLSDRYLGDRFLPDKAIDMMDEAGSMTKMLEEEDGNEIVTEDSIATVIAEVTGIPVGRLDTGEKERLRKLDAEIGKRIKGQGAAVKSVSKAVRRSRAGMRDAKRPVSSFLFAGPTGVGKTELCKALAETYFGREKDMIRIDMTEYTDRFSLTRLVGAPPGYVGYDEGGQLTEAVRRSPHSVVLFDELEKAHEDVTNILLQIMDDGQLTDGKGRRVNFKNTICVMTTNLGSKRIQELSRGGASMEAIVGAVQGELEEKMKPELLNRFDETIIFNPLGYDNLRDITSNLVSDSIERAYADREIVLKVSDSVKEAITLEAQSSANQYGARPLRRAVQRYVDDTMAEAIMSDFVSDGDEAKLMLERGASGDKGAAVKIVAAGKRKIFNVDPEGGIGSATVEDDPSDGDDDDDDDTPPPKVQTYEPPTDPDAFQ